MTALCDGRYTSLVGSYYAEDCSYMKRMLVVVFVLLSLTGLAAATSLCTATSLQDYINNSQGFANACSIGDKLFYNFSYEVVSGAAIAPTASSFAIVLEPGDGFSNPGLGFSTSGLIVGPGQAMDVKILYDVATLSGGAYIEDYSLTITGSHRAGRTGSAVVTESFANAPTGTPLNTSIGGSFSKTAHVAFLPLISSTSVTTEIVMRAPSGTTTGDTVSVSLIEEQFSEKLPEPFSTVLIGSGLALLGWRRRFVK